MSNIGLMDGAFFVGRKEILEWINSTLGLKLTKIEDTAFGGVAIQLTDIMYPGAVPMHKVNWSARQSFEFVGNYKVLQTCFAKQKVERFVDVDKLIKGKYQDNLEFMQWMKCFFEMNVSEVSEDYDAVAQRLRGKGGAAYQQQYGCKKGEVPMAAPKRRVPPSGRLAQQKENKTNPNPRPVSATGIKKTSPAAATVDTSAKDAEIAELRRTIETQVRGACSLSFSLSSMLTQYLYIFLIIVLLPL